MREYMYGLISGDATLADIAGYADTQELSAAVFASNSVDTPPTRPFIAIHWSSTNAVLFRDSSVSSRNLSIWAYDKPADYTRIDNILRRIRTLVTLAVGVQTELGWLHQVDWLGESDDLWDESYQAIARNVSLRCVGTI